MYLPDSSGNVSGYNIGTVSPDNLAFNRFGDSVSVSSLVPLNVNGCHCVGI